MNFQYFFEICDLETDELIEESGPYMTAKLRDKAMQDYALSVDSEEHYTVPTQRFGA